MPDPNQNSSNQTSVAAPVAPSVFPQSDLPPLPPDFQNAVNNPVTTTTTTTVSKEPVNSSLSPIISSSPKKKFGKGRIFASVLGILLLVGGVGTGVYLVRQQQNLASQAGPNNGLSQGGRWNTNEGCHGSGCVNGPVVGQGGTYIAPAPAPEPPAPANPVTKAYLMPDGTYAFVTAPNTYDPNTTLPNVPGGYTLDQVLNTNAANDSNKAGAYCSSGQCPQETDTNVAGYYIAPNGKYYPVQTSTGGGGGGGGGGTTTTTTTVDTATAPPSGQTAECSGVKAYSSTWALLTQADLSTLTAGTTINFCATVSPAEGFAGSVYFTFNGIAQSGKASLRTEQNAYCQSYTIPAATTEFNVSAQVNNVIPI